jgi:hypothetical protein
MMTNGFGRAPDEQVIRSALQDALRDRFDGVDWDRLCDRIVADAVSRGGVAQRPVEILAAWSVRGAVAAGALFAAGLAVLLFVSDSGEADTVPPGFWPVAEELIAGVPEDTRRLIEAGADVDGLLRLMVADGGRESTPR